jgi:nitroimidazol reductase NimA-like FMN-containing flavoprotein (pyridoxamine 5'-phosphate oxidase superfamily)
MNRPALERIGKLLSTQRFAVLCTSTQGFPYASLVAVAEEADLRCLYFATPEKTQKTANLYADGRVALLVDDRSNRAEDCQGGIAVTILGRAELLLETAKDKVLPVYLQKHPNLKAFVEASDTVLVCVHVERYRLVEQFQTTTDIEF